MHITWGPIVVKVPHIIYDGELLQVKIFLVHFFFFFKYLFSRRGDGQLLLPAPGGRPWLPRSCQFLCIYHISPPPSQFLCLPYAWGPLVRFLCMLYGGALTYFLFFNFNALNYLCGPPILLNFQASPLGAHDYIVYTSLSLVLYLQMCEC